MRYITQSLKHVFGYKVARPSKEEMSPEVQAVYERKKGELTKEKLEAVRHEHKGTFLNKWQKRRWATLIFVNLLFVASFYFDVQLVEGSLSGARVVGFHMADLNSALQIALAYKHIVLNLVIGLTTPPVGVCLFIACAIGKIRLERISRAILPFILASIAVLVIATYWEWLIMFIPKYFGYVPVVN